MHRDIIGEAISSSFATFRVTAGAGIMWILMRAEIEDRIVLFKNMLCSVAVVDIEINDEDLPES
jgi:hypothetical protein